MKIMRPIENHRHPPTFLRPARLASLLIWAITLGACVGSKPHEGGKALIARTQTGDIARVLTQGPDAAQPRGISDQSLHLAEQNSNSFNPYLTG
jgi:hypothetical protein